MSNMNVSSKRSARTALRAALVAAGLLIPMQSVSAQNNDYYRVRAGLGGQIRPEFIGADSTEWAPLFDLSIKQGEAPFDFGAPDDNFDITLYSKNGFSVGPVANIQSGRKNKDVGAPVGKVKTTIEAGLFTQYQLNDSLRLRAEARKGIGGHDGVVVSAGGDYVWRDGDRYVLSIGPRVLWSNGRYQREWFGVTPDVALATGLSPYRPGSGIHAVAGTSGAYVQLFGDVGLFGYGRYERLVGDAAKSPIIRELGSRNQVSGGIGLTYTFRVRR